MRPVNLLPEQHRPRTASGDRSGVAYGVLGALGVVLLAVVALVLTGNDIASSKDDLAKLERDTAAAEARAGSLGPVADFVSIKQQREQSVRDLADRRFDWERMARELARVMPRGAFMTNLSASLSGEEEASSSATPVAAGATPVAQPTLLLDGCARNQRQVADVLVRMRRLHLADSVELAESARIEIEPGAVAAGDASGFAEPCSDYIFKVSVKFDPAALAAPPATTDKVPVSLGGGQ